MTRLAKGEMVEQIDETYPRMDDLPCQEWKGG
jgi:hypothetical protein